MKFNLGSEQTTLDNFFGSQSKKRETRPQQNHTTATANIIRKEKQSGDSSRESATRSHDDVGPPFKKPKMTGQLSPPSSSYDQSSVQNQASPSKHLITTLETPRQASHSGALASKTSAKASSGQTPGTNPRRRTRTAALVLPTPPATTDKHNLRNKRPRFSALRSPSSDDGGGQPSSSYLPTISKLRSPVRASSTRRPLQFSPSTPRTMRLKSTVAPFATTSPKFVPSSQTPEKYGITTRSPASSPHSGKVAHRPRTSSNASSSSLSSIPSDIESPLRKQPPVLLASGSGSPKKGKENNASPSRSRIALNFKPVGLDFTEVIEDSQSSPLRPRAATTLTKTLQRERGTVLVPSSESHKKVSELLTDPEDDDDEEAIPDSPSLPAGQIHLPLPHASPVFKVPQPLSGPLRFPIEKSSRHELSTSTSAAANLSPRHDLGIRDAEQHEFNTEDYIPSSQTQLELVPASPMKVKRFHRPDIHPYQPCDLREDDHSSSKYELIPSSQSQIEREMSFPTYHPLDEGSEVASGSQDSKSSLPHSGLPTSPVSRLRHSHHEQAHSISDPVLPSLPMSHYGSLQDLPSWLFEEETRMHLFEPGHLTAPSTPVKVLKALPKTPQSKRKVMQKHSPTEIMAHKSTTPSTPARKHRGSDDTKSPFGFSPRASPRTPTKLSPLRSAVIAAAAAASLNRLQPKTPRIDPFATLSDDPIVLEGAPPNIPSSSTFPSSDSDYGEYQIGSDAPSVVREFTALFEGSGSFPDDFPESLK